MKYCTSNEEVKLGDKVLYAGAKAFVFELKHSLQADTGHDVEENDGILIRFENGALAMLDEPDEDLTFIGRRDS